MSFSMKQKSQSLLLVLGLTLSSTGLMTEEVAISLPGALSSVLTGPGGLVAVRTSPEQVDYR